MGTLIKLALLIGAAYMLYKSAKEALRLPNRYGQRPATDPQSRKNRNQNEIVDICPRCGEVEEKGHHC